MKDAVKINIDNTEATEEDKAWARAFLYPDLRKPYELFYNAQNYRYAHDLVARARAAMRQEQEVYRSTVKSTTYTSTTQGLRPVTEQEAEAVKGIMKEYNKMMHSIDKGFKRISKRFRKI